MYNLKIISSTTRPGRKGPIIANWITRVADQHESFEVKMLDLGEIALPLWDEPHHPIMKKYQNEHTEKWSREIDEADAFIFVTAEYNHSYPASMHNALQYLHQEWNYKAAGIVSYGGVSAGTRAFEDLVKALATLKMVPLMEAVNIPFFTQFINDENQLVPNEKLQDAADTMLDELARWTAGLKVVQDNEAVSV